MVGDADHDEAVEFGVFKGEFINIAGFSSDFIAVDFFGLF